MLLLWFHGVAVSTPALLAESPEFNSQEPYIQMAAYDFTTTMYFTVPPLAACVGCKDSHCKFPPLWDK